MPDAPRRPVFRTLDRPACLAVLARHHVGRLAYCHRERVDIEPLHFVYAEGADGTGWCYGRTAEGAKLDAVAHNRWVALEADEVHGPYSWTSVVVRGALTRLDPAAAAPAERAAAERALAALRALEPATLAAGDPAPGRTVLFRVHVDDVSGREASPG